MTYGTVRLQSSGSREVWVIECEPQVRMRLKRVFSRIEQRTRGELELANTIENCRELQWFLDRYPMDVDPVGLLVRRAEDHKAQSARIRAVIDGKYTPPEFDLAIPLRDYQKVPPTIVLEHGALLLADPLGLGKTAQGLAMFVDPRTLPALVVTMTHLTGQWERELKKFAPQLRTHVIRTGRPYSIEGFMARRRKLSLAVSEPEQTSIFSQFPDVLIVNYHKLAGWRDTLAGVVNAVIFDECQELRHDTSARYGAAAHIRSGAKFCIGLTATPIYNYGSEMFNVMDIIKPDCLGDRNEFVREWCTQSYGQRQAKVTDPRAFGSYLRDAGLMLRRTRADVGRELPPVIRQTIEVEADTEALWRVENAATELARIILERGEQYRGQKMQASEELSNLVRQATGIAKAPFVADFVRFLVESSDEPVLLAGWHRAVYDIWRERLNDLNPVMYTGSESPTQKEAAVQKFLAGESKVMLISLRSGAGLDGLQKACRTIVVGELDWSPGVHRQLIGRLHRDDGHEDGVNVYFLVANHGSDPIVVDVLGLKQEQQQGIEDPNAALVEEQQDDDRIQRLARLYLREAIRDGAA